MSQEQQTVFISYTHDSPEHKEKVLRLADRLCSEGVDCNIDQYETSPPEGWARWMVNQVDNADFILVVCTEIYGRRFTGNEEAGKGLGAQWEGAVITQDLYNSAAHNTKFIPIVFSSEDGSFIPKILRGATYYRIDTEDGYDDLYRRLTDQRRVVKPSIGERRVLLPLNKVPAGNKNPEQNKAVVKAKTEPATNADAHSSRVNNNLLLIYLDDKTRSFIPIAQVTIGEFIEIRLRPENARQKAFLVDLSQRNKSEFAIAYKDDAWLVTLEKSVQNHDLDEEWKLTLKTKENSYSSSFMMEMSVNGYTGDDFAELRARRILLNEQIKKDNLWNRGSLDLGMVEHTVRAGNKVIEQIYCPIPTMFQEFKNDAERFLVATRLMCVLFLKINRVIQHIFTLELQMIDSDKVGVNFDRQRHKPYVNQEPTNIQLSGSCDLSR